MTMLTRNLNMTQFATKLQIQHYAKPIASTVSAVERFSSKTFFKRKVVTLLTVQHVIEQSITQIIPSALSHQTKQVKN